MWLVIPPTGAPYQFTSNVTEHGTTLADLQQLVGGYVEVVVLDIAASGPLDMWVNEEGAYSGHPVNRTATLLAQAFAPDTLLMPEGIRGGAVLTRSGSMGETIPLTPADIEMLTKMIEQSDGG